MEYLKKKFSVPVGGEKYAAGWDAIFGKKKAAEEASEEPPKETPPEAPGADDGPTSDG